MENGKNKKYDLIRRKCGEDFNKDSMSIYYCGLNKRIDKRCKSADVLGRYVFAKCSPKNCPKLHQELSK